jgi:DUF1009 family protein
VSGRKRVRIKIGTDSGLLCEFSIDPDATNRAKAFEELGRAIGAIIRDFTEGDEALLQRFVEQFELAGQQAVRTGNVVKVRIESEVSA